MANRLFFKTTDGKYIELNKALKPEDKVHKVMGEFKRGTLKSSSGQKVTDRSQAIAIAMSESGMSKAMVNDILIDYDDMEKANQLKEGIKVEKEHIPTMKYVKDSMGKYHKLATTEDIAKHIATDHLDEIGDYYTRLLEMEKQASADKKRPDIEVEVIKFLIKNPNPPDSKVHAFAESKGISPHKIEAVFYKLATERALMSKDMQKAGKTAVGTTATWADGKQYRKVSEGQWEPVKGDGKGHDVKLGGGAHGYGKHDVSTAPKLHKRFMDYLQNMSQEHRDIFRGGKFDFEKKTFTAIGGKVALLWKDDKVNIVKTDKMDKARVTKYIKRVPKPSGKGYYYFYTKQQFNQYKETGKVPEQEKGDSALQKIFKFLGVDNWMDGSKKIGQIYESNKSSLLNSDIDKKTFAEYSVEYLQNKEKYDAKFSGEKKEKSESKPKSESPKSEKTEKKESTGKKWNMSVMRTIAGIYGSGIKPVDKISDKPLPPKENDKNKKDKEKSDKSFEDEMEKRKKESNSVITTKRELYDKLFDEIKKFDNENTIGVIADKYGNDIINTKVDIDKVIADAEKIKELDGEKYIKLQHFLEAYSYERSPDEKFTAKDQIERYAQIFGQEAADKRTDKKSKDNFDTMPEGENKVDYNKEIKKLESKFEKLEEKRIKAKEKDQESYNKLNWGSGMRLSKLPALQKEDRVKDEIKEVKKELEKLKSQKPSATEALKEELGKKKSESKGEVVNPEVIIHGKIIDTSKVSTETNTTGFFDRPTMTFKQDGYFYLVDKESGIVLSQGKTKKNLMWDVKNQIDDNKVDKSRYESMIEEKLKLKNKAKDNIINKDKIEQEAKAKRDEERAKKDKEAKAEAIKIEAEDKKREDEKKTAQGRYDQAKKDIEVFEQEESKSDYSESEWQTYLKELQDEFVGDIKAFKDEKEGKYYKDAKKGLQKIKDYKESVKNLSKLKNDALDESGQGKMFKALSNLREELMFKAQTTKYIKRIPSPKGKGYIYFYTQDQVKAYQKDGTIPDQSKKPEAEVKKEGKGNIEILKESVKKVATILADALSARDAVQPTGAAVEQTGDNVAAKSKEKKRLEEKSVPDKKKPDNKPEDKPKK